MGAWGIKSRESDCGLDFLALIADRNFKKIDFREFDINNAMELLKKDITDEINYTNRGCSEEKMKFYFDEMFPERYAEAVLLVTECLAEFLKNGEFVFDYYEQKKAAVEKRIATFVYTSDDLKNLLSDLRTAIENQTEEVTWFEESSAKKWKAHVEDIYTAIENELSKMNQKN